MDVYIGCSGWNYKHWKNVFYPEKLPQKEWLEFYAEHFNTVEVNSSFYRLPREATVENWEKRTPENFCFTLKGNRYVTHTKKLNDPTESLEGFEAVASVMKTKLGCVLWQLPPSLQRDDDKLIDFCEAVDKRNNNIIEFRHTSWFNAEVYYMLQKYNVGFCSISAPDFPEDLILINEIVYFRFHGKGKSWYRYDYSETELREWYEKIISSGAEKAYIYFNNDLNAYAPQNAKLLQQMFDNE